MNERIIHTKLYSKIAKEVLQSVEGQLSDGIWENSPAMEKYWRFSDVTTAPDGEVLIKISTESYKHDRYCNKWTNNGFIDMNDDDVIKWFAAKVKHIMQVELKDEDVKDGWKRGNTSFNTGYLSYNEKITVSDIYFIYDFLLGRDTSRKYDVKQHMKIEGAPKSKADTKAEETRRANISKVETNWSAAVKQLDNEKRAKIAAIEAEFKTKLDACNDKYRTLRAEFAA